MIARPTQTPFHDVTDPKVAADLIRPLFGVLAPSSGPVSVTEMVPNGLMLVSMSGANWSCAGGNTCTRNDALNPGAAYPDLTVTVNVSSIAAATVTNQTMVAGGGAPSQTASDPTTILAQGSGIPAVVSATPPVSAGAAQSYTFRFSHTAGWQALGVVNVLINSALDGRNACYLAYSVPDQVLYLVPDSGGGLLPALALNGTGSTANQQCSVTSAGSSASGSGTALTLTLNVSFSSAFGGNKVVYMAARDSMGGNSGWQTMAVHGVPPLPAAFPSSIGMSPSSGTTAAAALTFTYQDASTANNLQTLWALMNSALDGRAACYVAYYVPGNQLYLYPDNGDGTHASSIVLTGSNTIANSQCVVSAAGSSYTRSGAQAVLTLNITLKPPLAGNKAVWMAAQTLAGAQTSDWQPLGVWTVPSN